MELRKEGERIRAREGIKKGQFLPVGKNIEKTELALTHRLGVRAT